MRDPHIDSRGCIVIDDGFEFYTQGSNGQIDKTVGNQLVFFVQSSVTLRLTQDQWRELARKVDGLLAARTLEGLRAPSGADACGQPVVVGFQVFPCGRPLRHVGSCAT